MPLMPKLKPKKKIKSIADIRAAAKEMEESPEEEASEQKAMPMKKAKPAQS